MGHGNSHKWGQGVKVGDKVSIRAPASPNIHGKQGIVRGIEPDEQYVRVEMLHKGPQKSTKIGIWCLKVIE